MPDVIATRARERHAAGDAVGAEALYLQALERDPGDLRLRHDHAVLLMQTGRPKEAAMQLEQVLVDAPQSADSATVLALCLRDAGRFERGREVADLATRLAPRDAVAWLLVGSLAVLAGDPVHAEPALRRALALEPNLAEAWHYLGQALQAQQRWADAAFAYQHSRVAQPGDVFNIALCAERAGQWDHARAGYQETCRLYPQRVDCVIRLAQVEAMTCRFDAEARQMADLHLRLEDQARAAPDDVPEAFPLSYLPLSDDARRTLLERYATRVQQRAEALGGSLPAAPQTCLDPSSRRRIGYLSADFGEHPVGVLVRSLFAAHDREVVEVHAYSLMPHQDAVAADIRTGVEHFHDCQALGSLELARLIRSHGIEVLIDLSGYTGGGRPEIMALRPAPRQYGWLGFIHGQQAPWLDGILLDEQVLPSEAPWPYADRVLRLPAPLLPCGPMPSGRADRRRFDLPEDRPVLASFNSSYKLDAELVAAWVEILRRSPQALLLVYLPAHARAGFLAGWQAQGGDVAQLRLADWLPAEAQADRAASCDLFLDAFRYQAGATALAAIAAGLPILCRQGQTPLARLGVSLNRSLGLDELICADTAAYIAAAVELLDDPPRLALLRARMLRSPEWRRLFDPRRTAVAIEALCR